MDVILLNGPSSSGKSSIAKALQDMLDVPYLLIGIDTFISLMPDKTNKLGDIPEPAEGFYWETQHTSGESMYRVRKGRYGEQVNDAYRTTVKHLADSGLKVIVDEIADGNQEVEIWRALLEKHRCFYVGIKCSEAVLDQREWARGDRKVGSAREQMQRVHRGVNYDLVIDTTSASPQECALMITEAMKTPV
ncbi:AAA family ATPase [Vibrio sp. S9_S30]|uniref:chloramphenicol phosphotransferase CPT family protein n=1 Tax=Vibrio sp. S9_S30 TaxID=2720226 RepID=UPI001680B0F1|nr:AAA family ATPase [Vibrio sp. S9_S30]MBD1556388.1 AAA family ATPase [Vibrio sp. S9_S30]